MKKSTFTKADMIKFARFSKNSYSYSNTELAFEDWLKQEYPPEKPIKREKPKRNIDTESL